ncbi:MAG: hypothetical protein U0271_37460 [Polyangiaceae bacterium]
MSTADTTRDDAQPPALPKHVKALETALKLLAAAGRVATEAPATTFDLRPAATALESATVALLDAYDARRDPLEGVRTAMVDCDTAEAELTRAGDVDEGMKGVAAWVRAARDWLRVPEDAFARSHALAPPAREIVASQALPQAHRIERATIAPTFRVAAPLPTEVAPPPPLADEIAKLPMPERMRALKEKSKQAREAAAKSRDERNKAREDAMAKRRREDEVEPHPGFVAGEHVALSREAFIKQKARELLDDVAAMGMQRTPILGDYWKGALVFDQRMLRDIDAMAALGDVAVRSLETLVIDSPAKDSLRAFGVAMILGCFEGRDALAAIDRVTRYVGFGEPEAVNRVAMALKLVPHPELAPVMREWLSDDDAGLRAIAIDVLAHRRLAVHAELVAACGDASELVASRALLGAALADVKDLGKLLDAKSEAKTAELREAIAWATVLGSVNHPVDRLRAMLDQEGGDVALMPFALAADQDDADELIRRFAVKPTQKLATALGFLGSPKSIAPLVAALDAELAPELKQTVAFALQRITGGELYDRVEVPPESLEPEEPESPALPDDAPPLRRMASDRRDRPSDGASDTMTLPTTQSAAWRAFLAAEDVRFQGDRRLRRGDPFTPNQCVAEIDTYQITPAERRWLYRELIIKSGEVVPFDPVDFVPVQERAIKAMAAIAERASSVPGAWGRAARRSG